MKITGIILLVIGLILTIYTTFSYFTKEKVVDLGVIEIMADQPHNFSWPPILGIVVMCVGLFVVWLSVRK